MVSELVPILVLGKIQEPRFNAAAQLMRLSCSYPELREKSTVRTSHVSDPRQGDWELNCEVCLKRTHNQVKTSSSSLPSRSN